MTLSINYLPMDPANPNNPYNPPSTPTSPDPTVDLGQPQIDPSVPTTPVTSWDPQPLSSEPPPVADPNPPTWQQPSAQPPPESAPVTEMAPAQPAPITEPMTVTQNPSVDLSNLTAPVEGAPTDLTSLAAALGAPNNLGGPAPSPTDNPQSTQPENPTVVAVSSGFHLPKVVWIIGGVVLMLIVAGASAYFILGVGQTTETTSVPIEQQPLTNLPRALIPTPTPIVTDNTSLGSLSGASPSATPTETTGAGNAFERRTQ